MRRYNETIKADTRRRMNSPARQSVAQISMELGNYAPRPCRYTSTFPSTCTRYASTQSWCCFWVIAAATEAPSASRNLCRKAVTRAFSWGRGRPRTWACSCWITSGVRAARPTAPSSAGEIARVGACTSGLIAFVSPTGWG